MVGRFVLLAMVAVLVMTARIAAHMIVPELAIMGTVTFGAAALAILSFAVVPRPEPAMV